jgi:hypothetical protein
MNQSNFRTNDSFLSDLRQEIFQAQKRRGQILTLKLSFISGFFGIGSFDKIANSGLEINANYVFYIIPFIALIFDLYLMGEDYGIKRAGQFIKESAETPRVEKEWEAYIAQGKRDLFSTWAYRIYAVLIVFVCFIMVFPHHHMPSPFFYLWALLSIFYVVLQFIYKLILNRRLSNNKS